MSLIRLKKIKVVTPDEMVNTWVSFQRICPCKPTWPSYPKKRGAITTHGLCFENRVDNEMQHYIERPWSRVEKRSSRMTRPSVEAIQLCHRRLNMHAQAACVAEQA